MLDLSARSPCAPDQAPTVLPLDPDTMPLTPAQRRAYDDIEMMLDAMPLVALAGLNDTGRSTILKRIARNRDGRYVTISEIVAATTGHPADRSDTAIGDYLMGVLSETNLLVLDDTQAMGFATRVTRSGYLAVVVMAHLTATARQLGKRVLTTGGIWDNSTTPGTIYGPDTGIVVLGAFEAEDYRQVAINHMGADKAADIDFDTIIRFAAVLNAAQLATVSRVLALHDGATTSDFIDALPKLGIAVDNVRTSEVEALSFESLPGHEHIVDRLYTHIILPLEHHALAERLDLKPKRGVLLYGPPGTGKTSIGRALAHRMQGRFFMIDGTFISEPPGEFFRKINRVIDEAKRNSPSVLFIDDADVLFGLHHISGLSRLLLSLLDGLESETARGVCVMMTAMDVRQVPDSLIRSGRVELWLETKAPLADARARILERWMSVVMPDGAAVDYALLAARTDGFTPADLRRVTNDAKALYAADVVRKRPLQTTTDYVVGAIDAMIDLREKMAVNLADPSLRLGTAPAQRTQLASTAGYGAGIGGMANSEGGSEGGW